MKPAQHHHTDRITLDGVTYALPKGYVSADGVTVMRDDGFRLVPRQIVCEGDRLYINEHMSLVPRAGLRRVK